MLLLTEPQIYEFLDTVQWRTYENGVLKTTYEFEWFLEAINFINDLVPVCEVLGHHPDILIRYNEVTMMTTTHEMQGQITDTDIELVRAIEQLLV